MFDKVRIETLLNRVENAILLIQSKAGQLETPNDLSSLLLTIRQMKKELPNF